MNFNILCFMIQLLAVDIYGKLPKQPKKNNNGNLKQKVNIYI